MDKFEKLIKGIQEDLEMPEEIWDACLENIEQLPSRNIKKKNKKVIKYFVISAGAVLLWDSLLCYGEKRISGKTSKGSGNQRRECRCLCTV